MTDDLDITISYGGKEIETSLKQMKEISRDLISGKIKCVSKCHEAPCYFSDKGQHICSLCNEACDVKATY